MQSLRERLIERLNQCHREGKRSDSNGVYADFYTLNDKWGAKVYRVCRDRDASYRMQFQLANHDLAPFTGESYELPLNEKEILYVHETELVKPVVPHDRGIRQLQSFRNLTERERLRFLKHRWTLLEKLVALGFDWRDGHYGNFGWKTTASRCEQLVILDCADVAYVKNQPEYIYVKQSPIPYWALEEIA